MYYQSVLNLILDACVTLGLAVLSILAATTTIAVGYLVFKFGWSRVIKDQSLMLGGYYLRKVPIKGYNRFKSQKWNYQHQPWNNQ